MSLWRKSKPSSRGCAAAVVLLLAGPPTICSQQEHTTTVLPPTGANPTPQWITVAALGTTASTPERIRSCAASMKEEELKVRDAETAHLGRLARAINNNQTVPGTFTIEQEWALLNRNIEKLITCSTYDAGNDEGRRTTNSEHVSAINQKANPTEAGSSASANPITPVSGTQQSDPVIARTSWAGFVYQVEFHGKRFFLFPQSNAEKYVGQDGIVRYTKYETNGYRKARINVDPNTKEMTVDDPHNLFGLANQKTQ